MPESSSGTSPAYSARLDLPAHAVAHRIPPQGQRVSASDIVRAEERIGPINSHVKPAVSGRHQIDFAGPALGDVGLVGRAPDGVRELADVEPQAPGADLSVIANMHGLSGAQMKPARSHNDLGLEDTA